MATNPFPGLRPFEADEDHLFFGREADTDALLGRLRTTRCVTVLGASGSGKSSLVRSGLIPSLHSGFMAGAGSSWRVATMRPGDDPIGQLAAALSRHEALGRDDDLDGTRRVLIEATLRRGPQGLAEAVRQNRLPDGHNLLLLVDQFEEVFRCRRARAAHARDEAVAFVRLLLEGTRQQTWPVYVVLTMRSDFLGDCTDFPGLPEAVNAGVYLVGRMSREQVRSAITGPVAVAGGRITPRLVNRVLNDLGDDQDRLPRVQHALMRTWDHWTAREAADTDIDIDDYEAVGGLSSALSRHAEEAWRDAVQVADPGSVERLFKALTDLHSDPRGVRRPTSVAELAEIGGIDQAEIVRIVEVFRQPGRSFLLPAPPAALEATTIVDVAHESLARCWSRLIGWAEEEAEAANLYLRLASAADWHAAGKAALWRPPELRLAERWRTETRPTAAWGLRYAPAFDRAMAFLEASSAEHAARLAEVDAARRSTLRRTQWTAAVLATLLIAAVVLALVARRESRRATASLALARAAVDESLSSVDLDPARMGADVPALEELRRELLEKAQRFYETLAAVEPADGRARLDLAEAHLRLGHVNRLLQRTGDAEREYRDAIARFEALSADAPQVAEYRQALGDAYQWLAETLRPDPGRAADARASYDRALAMQEPFAVAPAPSVTAVRPLARTFYNRGILLAESSADLGAAATDFRAAARLLEPFAAADPSSAQELARALNNLAGVVSMDGRPAEARDMYGRAIALGERLVSSAPDHREYRLELAKYYNNLAALLPGQDLVAEADRASQRAIDLLDGLARLAPTLAIERADAYTLRGGILARGDLAAAEPEYARAVAAFAALGSDPRVRGLRDFHRRVSELLLDLAAISPGRPAAIPLRRLQERAVAWYGGLLDRLVTEGSLAEAQAALEPVSDLMAEAPDGVRAALAASHARLMRRADERR